MAIFKCKMCGGTLEVNPGESTGVCEYCGTEQTLPRLDDERKVNLYDRANHFRRNNDFDKAMGIYEQILNEDGTDAEAYWSLVLCRYGIEYVEDPATKKRIPTVNRAQYTSIYADEDYKSALQYADTYQKSIYEAEAKAIDEIQKGILEISQKEEPFDVFICYKETGNDGRRTPDSVLATELYHELTREGFKVFFSRITLEDKLGTAYEPYIFAALHSAKVMVALGTKAEYFNAVWVKNEWSRFLALIKSGERKTLIPAYKDMDPYDLPEEFSHLQAQDMSKLGFMSDLVRGINKILASEKEKTAVKETVVVNNSAGAGVAPLLKRAFMFLEDGEWSSADEYCEKVLDLDPENAEAYLGKLMAELRVRKEADLADCEQPFDNNSYYQKAVRFGSEEFAQKFDGYLEHINARNEENRLNALYSAAFEKMKKADSETEYKDAADCFEKISGFKDAAEKAKQCLEQVEACKEKIYNRAKEEMQVGELENYKRAVELFKRVLDYKDSRELEKQCWQCIKDLRNQKIYDKAKECLSGSEESDLLAAMDQLQRIAGWKDSDELIALCKEKVKEIEEQHTLKTELIVATLQIECVVFQEKLLNSKRLSLGFFAKKEKQQIEKEFEILAQKKNSIQEKLNKYDKQISNKEAIKQVNESPDLAKSVAFMLLDLKDSETAKWLLRELNNKYCIEVFFNILHKHLKNNQNNISISCTHIVGLKKDGTVVVTGENKNGECNVSKWRNIIAVSAGFHYTLGLNNNGTVVVTGENKDGQCNVSEWRDIIAISAGHSHTVGLKNNLTVVATGKNFFGQCDVSEWRDIIAISASAVHTVGLKSNGTVVATGRNDFGECNVSEWRDIIAISARDSHTVGLKSDGTVVATGRNDGGYGQCNVSKWRDIIAITTGQGCTIGLKKDGTIIAKGDHDHGQLKILDWNDIVAIDNNTYRTVGLKKNGKVVSTRGELGVGNFKGDVSGWNDIKVD